MQTKSDSRSPPTPQQAQPPPQARARRSAFTARLSSALSASSDAGKLSEDLSEFSQDELGAILAEWLLWARDDKLPPETTANGEPWRVWLVMGGRGAGKTRAGAEWVRAKALGIE